MRDLDTLPTRQAMRPRTGPRRIEIRNGRRIGGVVVEGSAHDADYDSLDEIPDQYLRDLAAELISEQEG